MPNITEFDPGSLRIQPSETGVEAEAAAGRRLGGFYNQRAETLSRTGQEFGRDVATLGGMAVDYMDHQQINAGADHGATLFANLTDSWNKTSANADVHDPSVAQKWREEQLEPALQQFTQGFSTEKSQNWANRFVNTARDHFFTKTEADMSSMASVAVHESVANAVTKYSNVAVSDPSSVDASVKLFKQNLDDVIGANPNIKGPDAAKVRLEVGEKGVRQIVQAGALGAILNGRDPEAAAKAWSAKYPDYINGTEELQLAKAAKTQSRANLAYSKQIEVSNRQLAESNAANIHAGALDKYTLTDQNTGRTTIDPQYYQEAKKVLLSGAPNAGATYEHMINWADAKRKEAAGEVKVTTDPQVYSQLSNLVQSGDPRAENEIRKAEANFKVDGKSAGLLLNWDKAAKQVGNEPMFKYATDQAKIAIEGVTPADKAFAGGKFPAFMQSFVSEYLRQRNAGTLPPNALDLNDDKSLISQFLKPYRLDLGGVVKNNGGVGSVPVTPPPKLASPPMASM